MIGMEPRRKDGGNTKESGEAYMRSSTGTTLDDDDDYYFKYIIMNIFYSFTLYGAETGTINKHHKRLLSTEVDYWRRRTGEARRK